MNRRRFLPLVAALFLLSACSGGEKARVRYRVIAKAEVDGQPVEGSTVMEVVYSRVTHSLTGAGGATRLYGEALILDLKGLGTVFVLPEEHEDKSVMKQIYEWGILTTFGVENSIGTLEDADFARLRAAKGRRPFYLGRRNPSTRLPAFVAFRNEKIPKTIYEVDPRHMEWNFPGVRFIGLDIEITDAPVTKVTETTVAVACKSVRKSGIR